ncbi:MAG: DUF1588 domain-containing protein [Gemmataceae bacterium]
MRILLLSICLFSLASAPAWANTLRADMAGFKKTVAPFIKKYCTSCHAGRRPSAKLSLSKIDPDMLKGDDFETWRLIRERVEFGEMPPSDYDQPTKQEHQAVLTWIRTELRKMQMPGATAISKLVLPEYGNYVDHDALFAEKPGPVIPVRPRLWRIRPAIYERMAATLVRGQARGLSDPLNFRDGTQIKDYAAPYFIDEPTTNMLLSNAEKIVNQQVDARHHFVEIKKLVEDKTPTKKIIIDAIHFEYRLALHRSPTEKEVQRLVNFREKVAKKSGQAVASKTMLMAILMQPEVLFRFELGKGPVDELGRQRLSQREIAFAISFALSNRIDSELLKRAHEKKLATREQVVDYLKSRLGNLDNNPRIMQFFREYFGYTQVLDVFKDQPEKGRHEPKFLLNDIELLVGHILQKDENVLRELLTTNKVFVASKFGKSGKLEPIHNQRNRLFYATTFGFPPDWRWTDQQPLSVPKYQRAGILTHPAWLAAWGGNFDNHPVQRGLWVRTHLLGGTVPDVPIGVDARIPEGDHKQLGERLAMVTRKAECWRCHKKMNPLGRPFEQYDHYGRFRRFEAKRPVDVRGEINYTGDSKLDGTINGPIELLQKLAHSERVEQVFVRYAFRFFLGRNETLGDAKTLQDAHKAYRNNGGSFRAMTTALLSSDSFLVRKAEKEQR